MIPVLSTNVAIPQNQSSTRTMTHLRVNRLKILPNINVINVQLRMMTLYGIEKSGVGRSTRSVDVYMRFGMLAV